jgi:hypothetical protein
MKILLAAALILFIFTTPIAEGQLSPYSSYLICSDYGMIIEVMEKYQEKPIFVGMKESQFQDTEKQSVMVIITTNIKTGTWSQFDLIGNGVVCLSMYGTDGAVPYPGAQISY